MKRKREIEKVNTSGWGFELCLGFMAAEDSKSREIRVMKKMKTMNENENEEKAVETY